MVVVAAIQASPAVVALVVVEVAVVAVEVAAANFIVAGRRRANSSVIRGREGVQQESWQTSR